MLRKLLRARHGTASVEAVVMLPMLVLLMAGGYYVHRLGEAHQRMADQARACAWAYALASCPKTPPSACSGDPGKAEEGSGGEKSLSDGDSVGAFEHATGMLSFLKPIVDAYLGKSLQTKRTTEVRALMQGDEKVEVNADMVLLCNPRSFKFIDFLADIFSLAKL